MDRIEQGSQRPTEHLSILSVLPVNSGGRVSCSGSLGPLPEFYYGFLGVTFLWQIVFVLVAKEPLRYRLLMPITILEKFVYTVPVVLLYLDGRVRASIMQPSLAPMAATSVEQLGC